MEIDRWGKSAVLGGQFNGAKIMQISRDIVKTIFFQMSITENGRDQIWLCGHFLSINRCKLAFF